MSHFLRTPVALAVLLAAGPAAARPGSLDERAPQAAPSRDQAPVQARPGGPEMDRPRTDQTVDVARGTRLVLSNQAGDVTVRAWDRDAVRVQASHSSRETVDMQTNDNTLRVRSRSSGGGRRLVDYALTVPRWMAVNLSGTYLAASIEGTSAEVNVETVGGDLTVKGGSGAVTLRSIEGEIRVDGATGRLQATTVNDSITLNNVSGDVVAETTNGDVTITGSRAASLEVSTVNGDVRFEGPTADKGTYRVSTHNGDIRVSLGQQANATVFVRTFGGDFSSDFPITLPDGMNARSGNKRFNFTLGSGSARVEIESFQGDIHVTKGPIGSPAEERRRRRGGRGPALGGVIDDAVRQALDEANAAVRDILPTLRGLGVALETLPLPDLSDPPPVSPAPPIPPAPPRPPKPPRR
ncbi:MAG: DUF4097 family beta strand repeat-containing protein [Vicinamibacterales bacterium]